jgi:hypothetical protein
MRAGWDAAPAVVPRKRNSGTPRVTVRPYYGGPPFSGLDAGRMNGGETCWDKGGRDAPCPAPEATVLGCKVAAVERRTAGARAQRARRRKASADGCAFRRSIPLALSEEGRETGRRAPDPRPRAINRAFKTPKSTHRSSRRENRADELW